ncbi:hypothetical protein BX070DRAFT_235068 [Coemansia spiralis]|nr:hypothetical protein BX070DRAFT_235068 [Coemansia spiralis]
MLGFVKKTRQHNNSHSTTPDSTTAEPETKNAITATTATTTTTSATAPAPATSPPREEETTSSAYRVPDISEQTAMRFKSSADESNNKNADKAVGKKGKKFSTKNSMLGILDQVSQVEETRLNQKLHRQKTIKKMVEETQKRAAEKKKKKGSRFDEIKSQLRQGYSLNQQGKPQKKQKKKSGMARTLSAINREWDAIPDASDTATIDTPDPDPELDSQTASPKSKKTVKFLV